MGTTSNSQITTLLHQHQASLPTWRPDEDAKREWWGLRRNWPWLILFVGLPAGGAIGIGFADLSANVTTGLLVGIGVLGGLLFQVLAWVSSRIAAIADTMDGRKASPYELALVRRLDIARANIAYASLVSLVFVVVLGVGSMLTKTPHWLNLCYAFLLLHLGLTLILVLLRINSIGQNDRVSMLTAHARETTRNHREGVDRAAS
jgi:hypothetical protein